MNPGKLENDTKIIIFPLGSAKPNAAHLAITELQKKDKCDAIITQNYDGLHHKAGSKNIFEFHGTIIMQIVLIDALQS
jgi:NAD-dependent deacetylase